MKKKAKSLFMVAIMILSSSLTVFAEEYKGEAGWEVVFDGRKVESNFSSANIDDAIYAIQPGDTMEMSVTVKNDSDIATDWYMTNKVLKTLEEADAKGQDLPSGGAYGYLLTYKDPNGDITTLYRSENLGGDSAEGEVGLLAATDSLDEYFFLDRLEIGKYGIVTLKVSLEGETQGNSYQNTLARVQMNFAVERATAFDNPRVPDKDREEKPTVPESSKPSTPNNQQQTIIIENQIQKEEQSSSTIDSSSPKTGDRANFLHPMMMMVTGLVFMVAGIMKSRYNPDAKEGEGRRRNG